VVPFRCRSRRHEGPCADAWRRELYCRQRDGQLRDASQREVSFLTWTLPARYHRTRNETPRELWTREDWARDSQRHRESTRALTRLVSDHLRGINQLLERRGLPRLRYVWVVEAHRSGVPHAHAVIVSEWLASELRGERPGLDAYTCGKPSRTVRRARPHGVGRLDHSCARSVESIESYLSKLAGELAKGQGSLTLGHHQRSYGASRGMLAPRHASDGRFTGALVTREGSLVAACAKRRNAAAALAIAPRESVDSMTGEVSTRLHVGLGNHFADAAFYCLTSIANHARGPRTKSQCIPCDKWRSTDTARASPHTPAIRTRHAHMSTRPEPRPAAPTEAPVGRSLPRLV
jgi:hypothetical protein